MDGSEQPAREATGVTASTSSESHHRFKMGDAVRLARKGGPMYAFIADAAVTGADAPHPGRIKVRFADDGKEYHARPEALHVLEKVSARSLPSSLLSQQPSSLL